MLFQINDGTVSLGEKEILTHIDFEIKDREKVAIVGRNGVGKTTLLRLLAGELGLDRDDKRMGPGVKSSRKITVGMLHQTPAADKDKTIQDIMMEYCSESELYSRDHYLHEMEFNRIFTGFGFRPEDKKKKLSDFSGGEQTKISLIRLLLEKPDVLLLDEPTNHLDIPTVEWLEGYLRSYEKAVIFVSHDRYFLDQVVTIVYELRDGRLKKYHGNYTEYRKQKVRELAAAQKAYERQEEELKRLNGLIEKFKNKPKKAAFARSRKKIIERMDLMEKPDSDDVHIFTGAIDPQIIGSKWVLEAEHLKIGYDKVLLEIGMRIKRGQKIGIIGDNGVGKSTFIKTAAGLLQPLGGKCVTGNQIVMGYFDQMTSEMESKKTVVEHFRDLFPSLQEKEVRQILGAYLFSGKKAGIPVSSLSGGEKSRLFLAELLTSRPNFLILDEPTNHMDIQARETLESAFRNYTGTMLFVSHDRYFIRQVADAILVFEKGKTYYYPFGYDHYLKHCRDKEESSISALVQAEDQALVAGLQAVPKRERRFLPELTTDEAYLEWKLRLQEEPLEASALRVEQLYLKKHELLQFMEWKEELEQVENDLQEAWEAWTKECLAWAEIALWE